MMTDEVAAMNIAYWADLDSPMRRLPVSVADDDKFVTTRTTWLNDASRLDDPVLQQLYDFWCGARNGAAMPPVSAIDPFSLRFALGNLVVMEPIAGGLDFRVRLFGSRVASRLGYDLTGRLLSSISDHTARHYTEQAVAKVLHGEQPMLLQRHRRLDQGPVDYTCLLLPFGNGAPSRILYGVRFADED
jgi:hypothetical protein